jgi:outer membrane lipoprotein SlyB
MKQLLSPMAMPALMAACVITSGCAVSASAGSFPRASARSAFDVSYGEVISTRMVEIEGDSTVLGPLGGVWIGTALGRGDSSMFTASSQRGAAMGGVAGAVAGGAIERRLKREDGLEIIVRLDHNEVIAVVQASDIEFSEGDRVQVLFGRDGSTRVQPQ